MKKITLLLFLLITGFTLIACQDSTEHPDIVTTMYAHYDIATQIVEDKMTVDMLIPLGADIHSFEPSSKDMIDIYESKIFIYTSEDIDQWLKNDEQIENLDGIVLDMSKSYTSSEQDHAIYPSNDETTLKTMPLVEDEHDDHDHEDDLHYWVDPTTFIQMIDYVLEHIIIVDPENEAFYTQNARDYQSEILVLHEDIDAFFSQDLYKESLIYFAGHNALGAFASRYHIHIESLFSEFKPDDDLTSTEILNFSQLVKNAGTHYLFTEALIEPRAAIAIKENLASEDDYTLNILELHTYHNVNQEDWEAKVTYNDLLLRNFNHIKEALGATNSND